MGKGRKRDDEDGLLDPTGKFLFAKYMGNGYHTFLT